MFTLCLLVLHSVCKPKAFVYWLHLLLRQAKHYALFIVIWVLGVVHDEKCMEMNTSCRQKYRLGKITLMFIRLISCTLEYWNVQSNVSKTIPLRTKESGHQCRQVTAMGREGYKMTPVFVGGYNFFICQKFLFAAYKCVT